MPEPSSELPRPIIPENNQPNADQIKAEIAAKAIDPVEQLGQGAARISTAKQLTGVVGNFFKIGFTGLGKIGEVAAADSVNIASLVVPALDKVEILNPEKISGKLIRAIGGEAFGKLVENIEGKDPLKDVPDLIKTGSKIGAVAVNPALILAPAGWATVSIYVDTMKSHMENLAKVPEIISTDPLLNATSDSIKGGLESSKNAVADVSKKAFEKIQKRFQRNKEDPNLNAAAQTFKDSTETK